LNENGTFFKETDAGIFFEKIGLKAILNTIDDGIDVVTGKFQVLYANDNLKKMVGRQELEGSICYEAFLGKKGPCRNCPVQRALASGRTESTEIRLRSGLILEIRSSPINLPSGEKGAIEISRDISLQKAAEEALHKEKERFQILVEKAPFGVVLVGEDGRYHYVNPKFTEIFGYDLGDVPSGREWFRKAFPDPDYRKRVIGLWIKDHQKARPGEAHPQVLKIICKNGSRKIIHTRSVTLEGGEVLVTFEDITKRKRLEAQLLRAQRMEATGTLAGGIAHDFNNLLMGIQGNISLMLFDLDPTHPYYERLKQIENYVQSGAELTKQLLGFAKGGKYEVKASDLNQILGKAARMFGRTKKEISLHMDLEKNLPAVEVDRAQIEQVFMNLFVNAWQAMPDGGDLYLSTENVLLDEAYVKPYGVHAGRYVKVSVTDTGIGMDEEIKQRIFDPFFTTKGMGKGTGLGLASAYGIIKNHGGIINVYSEKGEGSTFNIYLPVSEKRVEEDGSAPDGILLGEETLLLVDDEEAILQVGKALLETLGYEVLTAASGKEAIRLFSKDKDRIALVILDMIMPEMGGAATYDALRSIDPNVKVLLSSGYSMNGQAMEILEKGCKGFIQKPFNLQQISHEIRKILDEE